MEQASSLDTVVSKFQDQMRRIDDMEDRLDAQTTRTRRRVASVLDQHYSNEERQSHLRLWVSHLHHKSQTEKMDSRNSTEGSNSTASEGATDTPNEKSAPRTVPESFTVQLEGTLLIGNLDHASAHEFDRQTGYQIPQDDLDRSRGGEKEDDLTITAYRFTHLFRKVEVDFQTVYQPAVQASSPMPTKKSTRRSSDSGISSAKKKKKGKKQAMIDPNQIDYRSCVLSPKQRMVWKTDMTEDAHAWAFNYVPPPAQPGWQIHSVVAKLALFPLASDTSRANRRFHRYSVRHPRLVKELFPHHAFVPDEDVPSKQEQEESSAAGSGGDDVAATPPSAKKRKTVDDWTTADGNPLPPVDNELHVQPATLTLSEIMMSLFTYVREKKLMANQQPPETRAPGDDDKTSIVCDALLQDVLGMERLPFSQLQSTLLQRNAIVRVIQPPPVRATYVMRLPSSNTTPPSDDDDSSPAPWQWDMVCAIPHLFPFRARELLRRVKRRELEYTSSRTKGRYLLAATSRSLNSEDVRQVVDSAVTDKSLIPQVVWHALAKGAPPHTEARRAAQLEAQWTYLLQDVLPASFRDARQAHELVDLCQHLGKDEDAEVIE